MQIFAQTPAGLVDVASEFNKVKESYQKEEYGPLFQRELWRTMCALHIQYPKYLGLPLKTHGV